ncbi:hypothetical protein AB0M86_29745 [Streptomyces sp. NPDC051639]|uniref:hypothetical protein n=1 Tax=unclassified Streptomyces TaxID=2593676 RepID=UPI002251D69F|nr:hypothetical protein [Streptomyces sp. NBC_01571]MCX4581112.1 hypothetical protein [Streptomyces sp. NBC_01571]
MLTTPEVRDHISELTDVGALLSVQAAATARLLQLDTPERPAITTGRTVTIESTISRPCLRYLTGTVQQPNRTGSRFDIYLDAASTKRLRSDQTNRWYKIPDDAERFRLKAVPVGCLKLTDATES